MPGSRGVKGSAVTLPLCPVARRQKLLMVQDAMRYAGVPEEHSEKTQRYFEYLQQRSHPGAEGVQFLQVRWRRWCLAASWRQPRACVPSAGLRAAYEREAVVWCARRTSRTRCTSACATSCTATTCTRCERPAGWLRWDAVFEPAACAAGCFSAVLRHRSRALRTGCAALEASSMPTTCPLTMHLARRPAGAAVQGHGRGLPERAVPAHAHDVGAAARDHLPSGRRGQRDVRAQEGLRGRDLQERPDAGAACHRCAPHRARGVRGWHSSHALVRGL